MKGKTSCSTKTTEHAQAQRERILCAAQKCFVERGFHAASMANISDEAEMSPGLIYRYFENKNAIILAIIARQLQEKRADIAVLKSESELSQRIEYLFKRWCTGDPGVMSAPLFLEMTAEASRDPQIAEALRDADAQSRMEFGTWLRQRKPDRSNTLDDAEAQWRSLGLQCFVEGLAIRAILEPDLDPAILTNSLNKLLPILLAEDS